MAASPSKPARPGVHSIDHFALEVPDLALARKFYETFGLRVEEKAGGLDIHASASPHRWGRLMQGPRKRLAYIALNCYAEDFDALKQQAQAAGATFTEPHPKGSAEGFWTRDPDGNAVQVRVGPKTMPDQKVQMRIKHAGGGERGVLGRSHYGKVQPRRLSHCLLFTPDVLKMVAFYENALGLKLSDRAQDLIAFTHGRYGSDHHMIAFAKSEAKGWHHSSWDVDGLEEVGRGADQMARAGWTKGWGTGRHVLGSNYFHYIQDPWGSFVEYSADIDYVPAGHNWAGDDWPPEDSLSLWGPEPPEIFLTNTEADLARQPA
jgi:catechol 2,3-dioxygenase-like lactoylglutathione lyase family enzyme